MARPALIPTLGVLLAAAFAGCLNNAADPAATVVDPESLPHSHGTDPMMSDFAMTMGQCEEGGFVAAYPMSEGANHFETWYLADITEEIGNPMRTGMGAPVTGPLMGNWHQGYRCADAKLEGDNSAEASELIFGFVGNMIAAPAFDPGGADIHFVISGLGIGNGTIAEVFKASNTASISHAYKAQVDWYIPREMPRSAAYVEFSDVEKGIYQSASELYKYRDVEARTVRLWWQVPVDGSEEAPNHNHESTSESMDDPMAEVVAWHPVYWDITSSGSEQYVTPPVDSVEVACHAGISDHGPQGRLCQPTLTNVHEHKSITFTQGDVIMDVTLTERWSH